MNEIENSYMEVVNIVKAARERAYSKVNPQRKIKRTKKRPQKRVKQAKIGRKTQY